MRLVQQIFDADACDGELDEAQNVTSNAGKALLTLRRALQRLGDVHVVDNVCLDAIASALDLQVRRARRCSLPACAGGLLRRQASQLLKHHVHGFHNAAYALATKFTAYPLVHGRAAWLTLAINLGIL